MWWFKCYENLRHVLFNGPRGHGSKCSTAKCAFQALEGLDVDIEARSFFAIREYIFKRHPSRIAGLQRPESHLVRGKAIECSNAFDPAFANNDTGAH